MVVWVTGGEVLGGWGVIVDYVEFGFWCLYVVLAFYFGEKVN